MKTTGISRVWLFVILFAAIVLAHIIVLRMVVKDGGGDPTPAAPAPAQTTPGDPGNSASPTRQTSAETKCGEEKPGFLKRWFGGSDKPAPAPTPTVSAPAAAPVPAQPEKPRLRVPSANPRFGAPLDFSGAIHGNMPERLVPGSVDAGTGIIVDMDTRKVLWEKDSAKPVPVASMVKMMTMLLTAEQLDRDGRLTLDSPIKITRTVMQVKRTGVLWLSPGEEFTLRELMLGVAVKSANDAATQVAEVVGGDVDAFVERMNKRAAELNLRSMVFYNPCGLPDRRGRNALSSAADMVLLGERLLEYPFILELCSTLSGSIRDGKNKTLFTNTNRLINPHYPGVDGLKTGYINQSGFCLTFSVLRNNRRIMGCVTGFKTARDRDRFCRKLIDWAYDPGRSTATNGAKPKNRAGTSSARKKSTRKSSSTGRK